jgi:hypothetical protein
MAAGSQRPHSSPFFNDRIPPKTSVAPEKTIEGTGLHGSAWAVSKIRVTGMMVRKEFHIVCSYNRVSVKTEGEDVFWFGGSVGDCG